MINLLKLAGDFEEAATQQVGDSEIQKEYTILEPEPFRDPKNIKIEILRKMSDLKNALYYITQFGKVYETLYQTVYEAYYKQEPYGPSSQMESILQTLKHNTLIHNLLISDAKLVELKDVKGQLVELKELQNELEKVYTNQITPVEEFDF